MISRLKEFRLKKVMTQEELAIKSNVSLRQIQKYESDIGFVYKCSVTTAKKIAYALNCQPEELFPYEVLLHMKTS